jgi:hypothetical protein
VRDGDVRAAWGAMRVLCIAQRARVGEMDVG